LSPHGDYVSKEACRTWTPSPKKWVIAGSFFNITEFFQKAFYFADCNSLAIQVQQIVTFLLKHSGVLSKNAGFAVLLSFKIDYRFCCSNEGIDVTV
jgi:hypothetical protein